MKVSHYKQILFATSSKPSSNRYLLGCFQRLISNETTTTYTKQRDVFLNKYTDLVNRQVINSDPRQKNVVLKLNDFCNEVLVEFEPEKQSKKKKLFSLKDLFSPKQTKPNPRVRSIYLYGGVGNHLYFTNI
jgi:predicted ATPase